MTASESAPTHFKCISCSAGPWSIDARGSCGKLVLDYHKSPNCKIEYLTDKQTTHSSQESLVEQKSKQSKMEVGDILALTRENVLPKFPITVKVLDVPRKRRRLTTTLKLKYLPSLITRDGFVCYQCSISLNGIKYIYEHLNDNRDENRIENIALSCWSCNNKKPHDIGMKEKALRKLAENEGSNYLRERKSVDESNQEFPPEIEINVSNYAITEKYVTSRISSSGSIEFSDALDSSVYLCKQRTGHGSQQSVRNYISTLTSDMGPFEIIRREDGKKIIRAKNRTTNQGEKAV